jgi:hypothetical protein
VLVELWRLLSLKAAEGALLLNRGAALT